MTKALRYLSHLLGAPVVAAPIFVALSYLTNATILQSAACLVFATMIPIGGIIRVARSANVDYDIPARDARAKPFFIAIVSYVFGFVLLVDLRAPVLLSGLMLAYSINTFGMFLITLSWKISVHAAGITGPLSVLIFKLGIAWGLLYAIVLPVGFVRIRLKQHSLPQIIAGAVLSALLTWVQIIFFFPLIPR